MIPAPTYFLMTFDVGAPEVSAWLIVASLVALALAVFGARTRIVARVAAVCAWVALALSVSVFARVPATITRFDAAMQRMSAEPAAPLRAHPVVIADLFRGIHAERAMVHRDIIFASPGGVKLTMDVYQPQRRGKFPIVVQIYGGAWQRGTPSSNANFASWLASSGYVVFAVDYRHAPAWKWPAQINDVDSSLAWIRDHAAEYDGDTSRVVLIGRSAGAHLAMLAAYRPAPVHIRGVVSYYGPAFLADAYRRPPRPDPMHIRPIEDAFLGGPPSAMPERYAEASPFTYATHRVPPTLLIYGRRDHVVEAKYGSRMHDELAATGTPVAYLEIPWAEHAFDAVFNGPSSQLALYYTERFIAWAVR
ncbi:MAG: Acetyl esterase/lipase [Gemmatimonadetes bacterium]|nr:Acetyl esterase/lipase [Gemmatimonadota bacterium]